MIIRFWRLLDTSWNRQAWSGFWWCYYLRHATNQDALLFTTLHYDSFMIKMIYISIIKPDYFKLTQLTSGNVTQFNYVKRYSWTREELQKSIEVLVLVSNGDLPQILQRFNANFAQITNLMQCCFTYPNITPNPMICLWWWESLDLTFWKYNKNTTIFNIICWVPGSMRRMTHRRSKK